MSRRPPLKPFFANWPLMRRIAASARPYRAQVLLLALLITVGTALPLLLPLLFREVVDRLIAGRPFSDLRLIVALVPVVGLAAVALSFVAARLAASIGFRVIKDLQDGLFRHLASMPLGFFTTVDSGAVISRLTNDVYATEPLFTSIFVTAIANTVTLVGAIAVLALVDIRLALVFLLIPLVLYPIRKAEARINLTIRSSFEENSKLSTVVQSVLTREGILLARETGQLPNEIDRFEALTSTLRGISVLGASWRASVGAVYETVFTLTTAALLAGGAWLVTEGEVSVGTLLLFLLYVRQIQGPVNSLIGLRYPALRAGIAFERVFDVLDARVDGASTTVAAGATPNPAPTPEQPTLRFENVRFRYPALDDISINGLSQISTVSIASLPITMVANEAPAPGSDRSRPWVLDGVTFDVHPGELVAVVGASGVGKSTIALLAAGLMLPTEGSVTIQGRESRTAGEGGFARDLTLITQETYVLHDTIANNLRYAKSGASDQEIAQACSRAQLDSLVSELREGYDTVIGEKGYRLSGGERQRLAIARALLKDPALIVLDEPTSQLDARTEAEIKNEMSALFAGKAVLMIAHRLSTIVDATRILVLEDGRVVESGNHSELMSLGRRYASLYEAQVRGLQAQDA